MTKMKKLNKIIPAVLLSGAMVMSTPNLISPTTANALENSSSSINNNNSEIPLSSIITKQDGLDENSSFENKIIVPSGKSIEVSLGKKYKKLEADLKTYRNYDCPLKFAFYFDGNEEANTEITVSACTDGHPTHLTLNNLKDVDKLKIEVTKVDPSYGGELITFTGSVENATLIKNNN